MTRSIEIDIYLNRPKHIIGDKKIYLPQKIIFSVLIILECVRDIYEYIKHVKLITV